MLDPVVVLFGLGVGILVGLTGIGGGSLMTPLLILFTGTSPAVAIGTDLAYGAVTKTLGGWRCLRQGTVDLTLSGWLAVGSLPGALLGVWLLERLQSAYGDAFQPYLLGALAGMLVVVAVALLVRALFMPHLVAQERETALLDGRRKVTTVAIGLVLGTALGLTSVGSGALIGLALILVFKLTPRRVVGTDVFHAAVLLWTAGLAHVAAGDVDFALMATILAGSLPGVWIGTSLLTRVPVDALRPALGVVLLAAALAVGAKAGLELPVAVLIGVPVVVSALAATVQMRRPAPVPA